MAFYLKNKTIILSGLLLFTLFSCTNKVESKEAAAPKKVHYEMYQASEMANFMNAMYAYNMQLKNEIVAGETPSLLPLDLLTLHSAEMTKGKQRHENWEHFATTFITSQEAVVDTVLQTNLKERYNTAITNCISCHKTVCTGPIPKIKKLLIP